MANYQVSATQLTAGSVVFIRGKLGFARLTRLFEGADLVARDQQKTSRGMNPVGKPHTTATVTQANVQFKDPANPTLEERFVEERFYDSTKNPASGKNYSIDSKGTGLPVIAIPSDAGDGKVVQDTSGRELANGLDVTLVLRVYKPKGFSNHGLALEQVIVNEPVQYYGGGGVSKDDLAAHGIVFAAPPQAVSAGSATATGEAAPVHEDQDESEAQLPLPQPAPTAAPTAVAPAAVAPAAAPAVEESLEDKVARLQAELEAANKDSGSAVGANPWDENAEADNAQGAGISYSG